MDPALTTSPWPLLPFALAASAVGIILGTGGSFAPAGDDAEHAQPADLVELEVMGVVAVDDEQSSIVVLREKAGQAILPIFIGKEEGTAIEIEVKKLSPPRPLTHDLLGRAIDALGAKVLRVEIEGVKDAVFRARIRLAQGGRPLELDARPSDSIALALRARAPIFATRQVVADAGLTKAEVDKIRRAPDAEMRRSRSAGGKKTFTF